VIGAETSRTSAPPCGPGPPPEGPHGGPSRGPLEREPLDRTRRRPGRSRRASRVAGQSPGSKSRRPRILPQLQAVHPRQRQDARGLLPQVGEVGGRQVPTTARLGQRGAGAKLAQAPLVALRDPDELHEGAPDFGLAHGPSSRARGPARGKTRGWESGRTRRPSLIRDNSRVSSIIALPFLEFWSGGSVLIDGHNFKITIVMIPRDRSPSCQPRLPGPHLFAEPHSPH